MKFTEAAVLCRVRSHLSATEKRFCQYISWTKMNRRYEFYNGSMHIKFSLQRFLIEPIIKPHSFRETCIITVKKHSLFATTKPIQEQKNSHLGNKFENPHREIWEKAAILTNWNSVAAPAPASAFLSAPAGWENTNYHVSQQFSYNQIQTRTVKRLLYIYNVRFIWASTLHYIKREDVKVNNFIYLTYI